LNETLNCPHCGIVVNKALMAKEAQELEDASPLQAKEILRNHSNSHAAGMRGRLPIAPMDQKYRSRGMLHRRLNIVSNCLAATFLQRPFVEKQRIDANALLSKHGMMWRIPEAKKKRAKTIAAGNDARNILSNKELLVGLFKIFYPEDWEEHMGDLDALGAAAATNTAVRNENPATATATGAGAARGKAKAISAAGKGKATRKGIVKGGAKKKKTVSTVCVIPGKQVTSTSYNTKRSAVASRAAPGAAASSTERQVEDLLESDDVKERDGSLELEVRRWRTCASWTRMTWAWAVSPPRSRYG
jgi:hypothetical protein